MDSDTEEEWGADDGAMPWDPHEPTSMRTVDVWWNRMYDSTEARGVRGCTDPDAWDWFVAWRTNNPERDGRRDVRRTPSGGMRLRAGLRALEQYDGHATTLREGEHRTFDRLNYWEPLMRDAEEATRHLRAIQINGFNGVRTRRAIQTAVAHSNAQSALLHLVDWLHPLLRLERVRYMQMQELLTRALRQRDRLERLFTNLRLGREWLIASGTQFEDIDQLPSDDDYSLPDDQPDEQWAPSSDEEGENEAAGASAGDPGAAVAGGGPVDYPELD